jgi:hypothetical protein
LSPTEDKVLAAPFSRATHYTTLPDVPAGEPLATEWAVYKRELPRWLLEGKEGSAVLIKGEEIIGFWPTRREALDAGRERFGMVPLMAKDIREWEPVYRQRLTGIHHFPVSTAPRPTSPNKRKPIESQAGSCPSGEQGDNDEHLRELS